MQKKVAIITDSNSGLTKKMAEEIGVYVIPMPFYIEGETHYEGVNLSQEDFYEMQEKGMEITTSQPLIGDILELWSTLLKEYDELVYIPMSSGLSGTCETGMLLAKEFKGKVEVVDNGRISLALMYSVMDAHKLATTGKSAKEIKEILMSTRTEFRIFVIADDLQYLKKGGRITPAVATIGSALNIKPVLQIGSEKINICAKVRGIKKAKRTMFEALEKEIKQSFSNKKIKMGIAYTCTDEEVAIFLEEANEFFPNCSFEVMPLSLSIATHLGSGAVGIGVVSEL